MVYSVYDIPLFYIGFKRDQNLEKDLSKKGFTNVNWFHAIDGRNETPTKLLEQGIISARSYDDLVSGREQHTGLSSLGAVGCTLSHNALWKKCSDEYPFMIIVESDLVINHEFTDKVTRDIQNTLEKDNGVFLTVDIKDRKGGGVWFNGLQMYFVTNSACKVLHKNCFPIEMQTDWYMSHLASQGEINANGYQLTRQQYPLVKLAMSSVQDLCLKCMIPQSNMFYLGMGIAIGLLLYYFFKARNDAESCKRDLNVCNLG